MRLLTSYALVSAASMAAAVSLPNRGSQAKRQWLPSLALPSFALPTLQLPSISIPPLPTISIPSLPTPTIPLPIPTPTVTGSDGAVYTPSTDYDPVQDVWTFKNIRFGAPPTGSLRFQKSIPPGPNDAKQANNTETTCHQVSPKFLPTEILGINTTYPNAGPWEAFLTSLTIANSIANGSEDCLFLDVYVPGSAFRPGAKSLPVAHWLFGGAFVFGAKDALEQVNFYNGAPLIDTSGGQMIYVASNYRLGAFGWLAGTTMERDGAPNAGLWDQRLAFQWTKDNIASFGGDPDQITAMGESAGASSIEHHLTLKGGTLPPAFSKVAIQSPAYQTLFDRRGAAETTYQQFLTYANCANQTIKCIQKANETALVNANVAVVQNAVLGTFGWGPTADGNLVRQVAPLEYLTGNYYKGLDSLLISHVSDEAGIFTSQTISNDDEFDNYLALIFPTKPANQSLKFVKEQYPSPYARNSPYPTEFQRLQDVIRDSTFTCNAFVMTQANPGKTYNMRYNVPADAALHATDLIPLYWTQSVTDRPAAGEGVISSLDPWLEVFAKSYQTLFTNYIQTGLPNTPISLQDVLMPEWTPSNIDAAGNLNNYLQADAWGFDLPNSPDPDLPYDKCKFWGDIAAAVTIWLGVAPPDAGLTSPYVTAADLANASIYYQGGNQ